MDKNIIFAVFAGLLMAVGHTEKDMFLLFAGLLIAGLYIGISAGQMMAGRFGHGKKRSH